MSDKHDEIGELTVVPAEITRQYPGKCIIYGEAEKRVIGVGDNWEEASDQAHASGDDGLWQYADAFNPDGSAEFDGPNRWVTLASGDNLPVTTPPGASTSSPSPP
jgi:hypothetical protein